MPGPKSRVVLSALAIFRAAGIFVTLLFFFVVGAPVQWVLLRFKLQLSPILPRLFYRIILWLVQVRVVVCGDKRDETPQLIVANHTSWTDIPALGTIYPVSFVSKREVSTWPIVATFARLEGTVFVDRNSRKSILEANSAMAERIRAGACVVLFPEGTTYDGTSLGPFHSSHFAVAEEFLAQSSGKISLCVQPVAIRYSSLHAAWIGDAPLLPHVIGLLRGAPVICDVIFCEPLTFDATADRKALAQECRQRIEAALNSAAAAAKALA